MWMLAYVIESDSPLFHVGQEVKVKVMAYPDRVFEGKISTIGATVDPTTHRLLVRSEIRDPKHELRPGMFATFVIRTGDSVRSTAVPADGVVREGDGTMTVWVTTDRRTFTKRTVKLGMQQGRLRSDRRRPAARRTDGHRRGAVSEQRPDKCDQMRSRDNRCLSQF